MKQCPSSTTSFWFNFSACLLAFAFVIASSWLQWTASLNAQSIAALSAFLVINTCWHFYKHPASLHKPSSWPVFFKRVGAKCIASYAWVMIALFIYWLFPLYHTAFYAPFFHFLNTTLPYWLVLTPFYLAITDCLQQEPEDKYWLFGSWLLRNQKPNQIQSNIKLTTAWLVKIFFTPLMIVFTTQQFDFFHHALSLGKITYLMDLFPAAVHIVFIIDVLIATAGYIFTFQLIDTDIQSTDPTFFGWMIALICYPPFQSILDSTYLNYTPNASIEYWFTTHIAAQELFMILALYCIILYLIATIAFGIRFSNLTYRGLISCGPYRHTKHPAYLYKNIFWWLTAIPYLLNQPAAGIIRSICLLVLMNTVYFLRAKTEERHLSRYPEYREYAAYIEEHGMYTCLGRWMPWLKFKPGRLLNLNSEQQPQ